MPLFYFNKQQINNKIKVNRPQLHRPYTVTERIQKYVGNHVPDWCFCSVTGG